MSTASVGNMGAQGNKAMLNNQAGILLHVQREIFSISIVKQSEK